jgi:hypothetical protein
MFMPQIENETDDMDSFCKELEHVFNKFPKYHMKILLDFNAKISKEDFLNQQLGMKVYTKLVTIMELE